MSEDKHSLGSQFLVAGLFLALALAALYGFVLVAEPDERTPQRSFRQDYSIKALADVLAEHGFEKRMKEIAEAGSAPGERGTGRMTGSPGFYRTEELILKTFHDAGLNVQTQEFQVVVPVTEICEILDEAGQPLADIEIYPYEPTGIMPAALPTEGISGNLLQMEAPSLEQLGDHRPEQTIALVTVEECAGWHALASVGVQALLVREANEDIRSVTRSSPDVQGRWGDVTSQTITAFPRFFVRGPIERYADKSVTIRCKVKWTVKRARNIIGVLGSDQPRKEALIVSCNYDSASVIPELAPGAEQSISIAALLEYVRGLALYRGDLERDVIFIAAAARAQNGVGESRLLEAVETFSSQYPDHQSFEARMAGQEQNLKYAVRGLDFLATIDREAKAASATGDSPPAPARLSAGEDGAFRKWLTKQMKTVSGEICLVRKEDALQARLAYLRAGSPAYRDGFDNVNATDEQRKDPENTHPLLTAYLGAKDAENRSANIVSLRIDQLVASPEFREWGYMAEAREYLQRIVDYHRQELLELADMIAVRDLFKRYERTLVINIDLYSGGYRSLSDLAVLVGVNNIGAKALPQVGDIASAISENVPEPDSKPAFRVVNWGAQDAAGSRWLPNKNSGVASIRWHAAGRQAFTIANREYAPSAETKVFTPEDTLAGIRQMDVLRQHIPAVGKALLAIAYGRVQFRPPWTLGTVSSISGNVFANVGVSEMVAGHPMWRNTFATLINRSTMAYESYAGGRGVREYPIFRVSPYGEYSRNVCASVPSPQGAVDAARFGDDGRIMYFKDDSSISQSVFRNEGFFTQNYTALGSLKPVNVEVFRCTPVTLYGQGNPTTLQDFKGTDFLGQRGLTAPERLHRGVSLTFLKPDFRFYVALKDGSAANEEIQVCRAFMLNVDRAAPIEDDEPEIFGRGYLAADVAAITYSEIDAAESMLRTADKRLALQRKFSMADRQMLDFHERGKEWLADAVAKRGENAQETARAASTSLAYAMNNHPVIRRRISHAVIGVIWYLVLLVPFVLFCEKLIFGFTDIRKQLLACGIIFLIVFAVLRFFHPAFQMVRSSMMILLGFIISLLTVMVTVMVSGKFKQNIRDLRSKEGRVEGADVSRGGVVGTAFMLGLNNMRRRKVRTWLTCSTLVLITFVMICFTSVSSDLESVEYATGRSSWNGIMMRDPDFRAMSGSEHSSIRALYGSRYPVTTHSWMAPSLNMYQGNTESIKNVEIGVDREFEVAGVKAAKRAQAAGSVLMEWNEPMFSGIDKLLLTNKGWFERPPTTTEEKIQAAKRGYRPSKQMILPDVMARELGITVEDVNAGDIILTVAGQEYVVRGIIDSTGLDKVVGLDGHSILPFDVNSIQAMGSRTTATGAQEGVVPRDVARLSAAEVVIVNSQVPAPQGGGDMLSSCLVLFPREPYRLTPTGPEFPAVDYREQRRTVLAHLERTGKSAYYSLDGVSYSGSRRRARSLGGMLELLVPILIAALAVFNTMRGSVYERRGEIYVYNAVGIAPNHVFFMFMAEACVYAVMGAMLGYLLSQGSGRALIAMGLSGGLNMDYSSIETIYASLAIMSAVLLSTILPARDAARMAAPSEIRDWAVPDIDGDLMSFNLPFTFTAHDRVAVISYFMRWLDSHGEGSSGPFFSSPPEVHVDEGDNEPAEAKLVPSVRATVWLKPYDLGVSQEMRISLPTDSETSEYAACVELRRVSGHTAAWKRTARPFLAVLRKQFLNWRATTTEDRAAMFAEAKQLIRENVTRAKDS